MTSYDSDDDPEILVGKRVNVRWKGNKWYQGTVIQYIPKTGEHHICYDDGDKKVYNMSDKRFFIVDETEANNDGAAAADGTADPASDPDDAPVVDDVDMGMRDGDLDGIDP
jgi:hypothetical protein